MLISAQGCMQTHTGGTHTFTHAGTPNHEGLGLSKHTKAHTSSHSGFSLHEMLLGHPPYTLVCAGSQMSHG
jgi:hypothetical protein